MCIRDRVYVLASMQILGFKVDREKLKEFGEGLSDSLELLTKDIYELAGGEFNINSTKQLGTVLFDDLGLPPVKKTKTGYSTTVSYTHLDVYKRQVLCIPLHSPPP